MRRIPFLLVLFALVLGACTTESKQQPRSQQELLSDFVDMRHGMFICFNIMSYGAKWGEANYPIASFNPTQLDCEQWAKAAVSAHMTFGLLTTKHHEGFALWDSKQHDYDVANTPYKKDIVRQYVDAFRKHKLKIGLYYSIADMTKEIEKGKITPEKIDFVKQEITELLSNYGKIDYFVVDGWFWQMGHREVPFVEIRDLIRSLQPECLITDHTHLQAPYHLDVPYFEGPFGAFPPENNTMASALGHCPAKGNGWFWSADTPTGMRDSAESVVDLLRKCEARYCNFMLNCMPNRDGLLDDNYIDLLGKIGTLWQADATRAPLPPQQRNILYEASIEKAEASSGDAANLIAARQYSTEYTTWTSDEKRSQSITLDLGKVYQNINILNFVQAHRCKPAPECALAEGNVTHCKLFVSEDGKSYKEVAEQRAEADAKMRSLIFDEVPVRYLRLDILDFNGSNAIINEVQAGNFQHALIQKP